MKKPLRWILLGAFTLALGCGGGPSDDDGGACCLAACVPTLGKLELVDDSTGLPISPEGTLEVQNPMSGKTIYSASLNAQTDPVLYLSSDQALTSYEGQAMSISIEIAATGYQPYAETHTIEISRASICCDSCLQSATQTEIRLMPI